jgi:hypothetical protein
MIKIIAITLNLIVATVVQSNSISAEPQNINNLQVLNNNNNSTEVENRFGFWDNDFPSPLLARRGSVNMALSLLPYAGAAYCSADSLKYWTCKNCIGYSSGTSNVVNLSSTLTDSSGYLAVNSYNRQIIISFKGTSSIFNWLYNAVIITNNAGVGGPYSSAAIHGGFNTIANYLYQQTEIALVNSMRQFPNYQVVFTGHSLGGAIAELMAFKLAKAGVIRYENINVYTYAQPKVGNSAFASYVNSQPWTYMRITSFGDPVPTLPPSILGFEHNEYNTFINSNGQTIMCTSAESDPNCITPPIYTNANAHGYFWGIKINPGC